MSRKYPECDTCYFQDRAPAICEQCINGDEYEPIDGDIDDDDDRLDSLSIGNHRGGSVFVLKQVKTRKRLKEAA